MGPYVRDDAFEPSRRHRDVVDRDHRRRRGRMDRSRACRRGCGEPDDDRGPAAGIVRDECGERWAMRRLPRKVWHSVHLTSFFVFIGSTAHAFQSGTDTMNALVQWLALLGTSAAMFLAL